MTKQRAIVELFVASLMWGFGFIAAIVALTAVGPFYISAFRLIVAGLVGLPVLFFQSVRNELNTKSLLLMSIPGICLGLSLVFQTWGLQYTTATNSGFITCLYAMMVPLLEMAVFRKRLPLIHLVWTGVALVGMALIVNYRFSSGVNFGDLLTFICAFCVSLQIIAIDRVVHRFRSAFVINMFQNFWGGVLCLIIALTFDEFPTLPISTKAWMGILFLTFGSTLLAFMLQVRAQRILSPSVSSLLFLMEAPFAAMFGYLLLQERMSLSRLFGAGLIFIAAIAATRVHSTPEK